MMSREPSSEELLADCKVQVRTLAKRAHAKPDALTAALFDVAMGDKQAWTAAELKALHRDLDNCTLRVRDWLLLQ